MIRQSAASTRSLLQRLVWWSRVFRLKLTGVQCRWNLRCAANVSIRRGFYKSKGRVVIGDHVELARGVCIDAWGGLVEIGDQVYIGPYSVIYGHGKVRIGRDSLLAMHVNVISADHQIADASEKIRWHEDIRGEIVVGGDVWLAAGVTVTRDCEVGQGAVVGAGAVVTRSIPAYTIAKGVPARVCGERPGTEKLNRHQNDKVASHDA